MALNIYLTFCVFVVIGSGQCLGQRNLPLSDELLLEKSCRLSLQDGECKCVYKWLGSRCCCVGERIDEVPSNLPDKMTTLFLYNTSIQHIEVDAFRNYINLELFHINLSYKLKSINGSTFERMRKLNKIFISNCPELTEISGTLLHRNHRLQSVVISNNRMLENLPEFEMNEHHRLTIDLFDLSGNGFRVIPGDRIRGIFAQNALFIGNQLEQIESNAFQNCQFIKLNFSYNPELHKIAPDAFAGILNVKELDLSGSRLTELPVQGLKKLERLRLRRVPTLKKLPSVLAFNNLHTAEFTYAFHCCFFKYATREFEKGGDSEFRSHYKEIQQRICKRETTPIGEKFLRRRKRNWVGSDDKNMDSWLDFFNITFPTDMPDDDQEAFSGEELGKSVVIKKCVDTAVSNFYLNITCTPEPDALNPCEDIVSYPTLRLFLWPMCLTALLGNISVWIIIAMVWQRRLRYHYFFMLNLSIADFLTGVYLAFLAIADCKTAEEYYNFALDWQAGLGCSIAGFINIFASELSIVSMLMISFEIYYNAKFAFYGKRMSALFAYGTLAAGYIYAILMAALPLIGVSSYGASSICLPLSLENLTDQIYLTAGLTTTALAFAGMIVNYVLINLMIRDKNVPSRSEDNQILFRTLVLIGTDMVCWLPTLFFGITAALGYPLITLTNAKICLILFYPINSCANPVLYVFMTKIWKDAKRKATFLEKFSSKHDKAQSQVNRFFYVPSPVNKDCRSPSGPDDEITKLLQVTQSTSLNSTPRGSSSSSSHLVNNQLGPEHRGPSRTSFQEHIADHTHYVEKKRKSIPSMPMFRLRVSAVPEMSDISESSSNSAEDYERRTRQKHKASVTSRLVVDEALKKLAQNEDTHFQESNDDYTSSTDNLVSAPTQFMTSPDNHPRIFFTHADEEDLHNETSEIRSR